MCDLWQEWILCVGSTHGTGLYLSGNDIDNDDDEMVALGEAMESLCNLEYLELNRVISSGLSVLAPLFQHEKSCL